MVAITTPLQAVQAPQIEEQMEIVYVPNFTSKEGVEAYIRYKFGASGDIAVKVMKAESSASTTVVNWKDVHKQAGCIGSSGLFQIGCGNAPIEEMKNPKKNIDMAWRLYNEKGRNGKQRGWLPWGVCTSNKVSCFSTPSEKPLATLSY